MKTNQKEMLNTRISDKLNSRETATFISVKQLASPSVKINFAAGFLDIVICCAVRLICQ